MTRKQVSTIINLSILFITLLYKIEQVNRIELSSSAWKADALAIVLHLQKKKKKSEKNIQTIIKNYKNPFFIIRSKSETTTDMP